MFVSFSNINKKLDNINFSKESFKIGGYPFYVNVIFTPNSETGNFSVRNFDDNVLGPSYNQKDYDEMAKEATKQQAEYDKQHPYNNQNKDIPKNTLRQENYVPYDDAQDNYVGPAGMQSTNGGPAYEGSQQQKHDNAMFEASKEAQEAIKKLGPASEVYKNARKTGDTNMPEVVQDYEAAKQDAQEKIAALRVRNDPVAQQEADRLQREYDQMTNIAKTSAIMTAVGTAMGTALRTISNIGHSAWNWVITTPVGAASGIAFIAIIAAFVGAKIWKKYAISTKRDKTCYAILEHVFTEELTKTELKKLSANNTLVRINLLKKLTVYSGVKDEYASMAEADVKMYYKPKVYANKFTDMKSLKAFVKTLK